VSREPSTESEFSGEQHLVEALVSQVDDGTVQALTNTQKEALRRFEKTNEMLANCAALSTQRLDRARKEAIASRELLRTMKADLENIFRRLRLFKQSLAIKYPEIYKQAEAESQHRYPKEDEL